jgi:glycosyl-4,4'-diaponeurosporenoate acyltransferase
MRVVHLSDRATVVLDIVAWGTVHATTGYLVHRLPVHRIDHDTWWSRTRGWESGGRVYERVLRIRVWKDRVPEAGALFAGGVSKRALPGRDVAALERFATETRRAELGHWLAACTSPWFSLWNPPGVALVMVAYGFGVNLPFIAIQRYNRARVLRVVRRATRSRPDRSSG